MNVNTKKGTIKLVATERRDLADAKGVLLDLARVAKGDLSSAAEDAAESLGAVLALLNGTPAEVGAGKPPY